MLKNIAQVATAGYLLTGALLAFLVAGCEQQAAPAAFAPAPAEVTGLEVQPRSLGLELEYPAQLRGAREVEVRARVSGILLERVFDEGGSVKAGDLLFRIDPQPFQAVVARLRADVGVQRVRLESARRERDRIVPLYEQGVASLRDRDATLVEFEGAQAGLAAAEAALRGAELDLSYTEVRAPIDGMTSREVRSEGSLVLAGTESSLLTYIVQTGRLHVDFALAEADATLVLAAVDAGAELTVRIVDTRGNAVGPAATIEFISPRADDATGTLAVRALLDNGDGRFVPGRFVRARIDGVSLPDTLVIPKRAVMHGAQGPYVWLIGAGNTATPQPVALGPASGNDVVVASGLSAGNRIVVDGTLKVQPGSLVNPTPLAADGTAPRASTSAAPTPSATTAAP